MKARAYQKKDTAAILAAFGRARRVLYGAPPGAGKTVVACFVVKRSRARRVLVLAHRIELIRQFKRAMRRLAIAPGRVAFGSDRKALGLPDAALARFDLVVVDEAHHVGAETLYHALLERTPSAKVLGLSASPYRAAGLREDFDELVLGPATGALIDAGYIARPRYFAVPREDEPDLSEVSVTGGDYHRGELARAVDRPRLVGNIVREVALHAPGRSTLVFAAGLGHARSIRLAFRAAGVDARVVHGDMNAGLRARRLKAFGAGRFPVLVNVMLFTEGLDVARIDCVVLARPTRSVVLFIQATGRAMRIAPDGFTPIVLDHSGAVWLHGLPDMDRDWTLDPAPRRGKGAGAPPPIKRCAQCGAVVHWSAERCACGAEAWKKDPAAELREITAARLTCQGFEGPCPGDARVHPATAFRARRQGRVLRCRNCAQRARYAAMSPEQRGESLRRFQAGMTNSERGARRRALAERLTPLERSAMSRGNSTAEQRSAWARSAQAARSAEDRSRSARKARATEPPEAKARRGGAWRDWYATLTPKQRQDRVLRANRVRNQSPAEQRSASMRKAWETRRAKAAGGTRGGR